jgi:hypothetical protein
MPNEEDGQEDRLEFPLLSNPFAGCKLLCAFFPVGLFLPESVCGLLPLLLLYKKQIMRIMMNEKLC